MTHAQLLSSQQIQALLDEPTKSNLSLVLNSLILPAAQFSTPDSSGLKLGSTSALCPEPVAQMEGLSRLFWGIFPSLAGSNNPIDLSALIQAVKQGTNPDNSEYWGDIGVIESKSGRSCSLWFRILSCPRPNKVHV